MGLPDPDRGLPECATPGCSGPVVIRMLRGRFRLVCECCGKGLQAEAEP